MIDPRKLEQIKARCEASRCDFCKGTGGYYALNRFGHVPKSPTTCAICNGNGFKEIRLDHPDITHLLSLVEQQREEIEKLESRRAEAAECASELLETSASITKEMDKLRAALEKADRALESIGNSCCSCIALDPVDHHEGCPVLNIKETLAAIREVNTDKPVRGPKPCSHCGGNGWEP